MSLSPDAIRPPIRQGPHSFEMTSQQPISRDIQRNSPTALRRFMRSFDRHPDSSNPDAELTLALDKSLKGYHSQFIALGSAIGTGLFIGSGEGLAVAGPISLLAAFSFVGLTLCPTVFALGELATLFPLPGGFFTHCRIYTDEAWGGAMGWKYV
jgi:amino acid transporter